MRRALIGVALAWAVCTAPAFAAFPGQNGRIAYDDPSDIHSVNPDGSGHVQLTTDPGNDFGPEWSPDGQRIAFTSDRGGLGSQVYVMNADGTAQTRLTDPPERSGGPAWSPDGERIVFSRGFDLWVMNADGTGQTPIATISGGAGAADWSPDGSRIAFVRDSGIWSIRPDGTGLMQSTSVPPWPQTYYGAPDWSPDGSRITATVSYEADGEYCADVFTVRPDGTGGTTVLPATCESGASSNQYADPGWSPDGSRIASRASALLTVKVDGSERIDLSGDAYATDWQPLPVETVGQHARPKRASPFRVSLVPAAKPCTSPNRTHGPPLAFGSCNPVQPGSSHLTVGVGDGNPAFARSSGFVRMAVQVGVPGPPDDSDVTIRFDLTNVMRASDLSEYTGELRTVLSVRRTDRDPPGASPHSTTMDFPFAFDVPCAPTPGSSLDGSTCSSLTSVNAVIPLAIEDAHLAVWELDTVHVYDGGLDEDADTEDDNSLFMTQGVFVP